MNQRNGIPAEITKITSDTLDVVTVSGPCYKKFYITANPGRDQEHYSMFENLVSFVRAQNAAIVKQQVFGACQLHTEGMRALKKVSGKINWPVTWIQGDCCPGGNLRGTQAYAISGTSLEPVLLHGQIVGHVFEDNDARYCLLGDIRPNDTSDSKPEQARAAFEKIKAALQVAEMHFSNVVRTWFYLHELLTWYDEFNEVRTNFFAEQGVFEDLVPASTGIGVANTAGAALVADVFAIMPKNTKVSVREVPSPLQCSAADYKSSFSRAVEVVLPDHHRLYISGTASIDPDGKTVHIGNVQKQIALTMEVAQAILQSRKMGWEDTNRGVAYFKDMRDAPLLDRYRKDNHIPPLPIVVSDAEICRDDLLFEIELDAIKTV